MPAESILNIRYGVAGDRNVGAHTPVSAKTAAEGELLFKSTLFLQRPVLDPCLAVGFLPFSSDCLRVGQLVSMQWRVERLKEVEESPGSPLDVSSSNLISLKINFFFFKKNLLTYLKTLV